MNRDENMATLRSNGVGEDKFDFENWADDEVDALARIFSAPQQMQKDIVALLEEQGPIINAPGPNGESQLRRSNLVFRGQTASDLDFMLITFVIAVENQMYYGKLTSKGEQLLDILRHAQASVVR